MSQLISRQHKVVCSWTVAMEKMMANGPTLAVMRCIQLSARNLLVCLKKLWFIVFIFGVAIPVSCSYLKEDNFILLYQSYQGIEDIQERKLFFTVCWQWQRFLKRCFNGVSVSVWYVSSALVVLHAGSNDQLQRRKNNLDQRQWRLFWSWK